MYPQFLQETAIFPWEWVCTFRILLCMALKIPFKIKFCQQRGIIYCTKDKQCISFHILNILTILHTFITYHFPLSRGPKSEANLPQNARTLPLQRCASRGNPPWSFHGNRSDCSGACVWSKANGELQVLLGDFECLVGGWGFMIQFDEHYICFKWVETVTTN